MQQARILFSFYRNFFLITFVITLVCCYSLLKAPTITMVPVFIFLKLFSNVVIAYLWYVLRSHELYFYYNLGWRKRSLFGLALLTDMLVFGLLITLLLFCL